MELNKIVILIIVLVLLLVAGAFYLALSGDLSSLIDKFLGWL